MLKLYNPHSILAALRTRPKDVTKVVSATGAAKKGEAWADVFSMHSPETDKTKGARKNSMDTNDKKEAGRGGTHALVKPRNPVEVEDLFSLGKENGHGLWVALDCLSDPQNVGAIFRTAAFFGVQGIILTQDRSSPMSGTVYDVATGGVEDVPFAQVTNMRNTFEVAKEKGIWILGSSEHGDQSHRSVVPDRPWLLVLGNEEKGMRRLTSDNCDLTCSIQGPGKVVTSLNVSAAAACLISHLS